MEGGHDRKNNVRYENSLEYWAIKNNKEYLIKEFSDINDKKPNEVSYGSNSVKYWWNCLKCKSEYDMFPNSRTKPNGSNCPYCSGYRVNRTNCLWTTYPEKAKLLANPEDGYEYTSHSRKRLDWQCPYCRELIRDRVIYSIINHGLPLCPRCSDGMSYPEKFMLNVLDQLNINFIYQKGFKWSKNKKYDFFISPSTIIEVHGGQHYQKGFENMGGRSLKEEKNNDVLKKLLAFDNDIENYIVIDCRFSELTFIKNNLLSSKLSVLFNLSKIDWLESHEFACNSMTKIACKLWNRHKNIIKISNELQLAKTTIIRYLKKGAKLGWCDYDPVEERRRAVSKNGKNNGKKVIKLSLQYEYIDEFESVAEAERQLGINNISAVCRGVRNKAGNFRWMYKKDYEDIKRLGKINKPTIIL